MEENTDHINDPGDDIKGRFYLLSIRIGPDQQQAHFHARSDHFIFAFESYLRLSDVMSQDEELHAYWIFLLEDTEDRYVKHGECFHNKETLDLDQVNEWLAEDDNLKPLTEK